MSTRPFSASSRSLSPSAASLIRDPLPTYSRLTPRDRVLLRLLDEHQVLLADQIERILFFNRRTCQLRLNILRELGFLDRFRFSQARGGAGLWRWVLGLGGARFQAAANGRALPTQRAHSAQVLRLSSNPALPHLMNSNEFFVRLLHASRTADAHERLTPETAAGSGTTIGRASNIIETSTGLTRSSSDSGLHRWWSECVATARFPGIAPDGHGIWSSDGRAVGLFLECDQGTENLARLGSKLAGYGRLADAGGPWYPVLFWLPSRDREDHLQRLLRAEHPVVPVATAVHDDDPSGPVWLPLDGGQRLHLHQLPSDHGPDSANNATWLDGELDLGDQRAARR
jgi:hypothetical protein